MAASDGQQAGDRAAGRGVQGKARLPGRRRIRQAARGRGEGRGTTRPVAGPPAAPAARRAMRGNVVTAAAVFGAALLLSSLLLVLGIRWAVNGAVDRLDGTVQAH